MRVGDRADIGHDVAGTTRDRPLSGSRSIATTTRPFVRSSASFVTASTMKVGLSPPWSRLE